MPRTATVSGLLLSCAALAGCAPHAPPAAPVSWASSASWTRAYADHPQRVPAEPAEAHLKDLRRLTFGGQNAEAYFSFDGRQLSLQSRPLGDTCDRIFRMPLPHAAPGLAGIDPPVPQPSAPPPFFPVTDGKGATTCAFFLPGDQELVWASTELGGAACPPKPDRGKGYAWALYDSYDLFRSRPDGTGVVRLTDTPGYDAEATVCKKDGGIVFTSTRDGDIELYRMDKDGKNVKRLTRAEGYDGGAVWSPDCSRIAWRASRPRPGEELDGYRELLKQGLVKPNKLELWVANADGSDAQQITWLDAATFAPFFFPSGKRLIFASNYGDPQHREFNLFAIDTDGSHLEQVTFARGFDGFPMFSPDGKLLAFESNRGLPDGSHETDVYLARWDESAQVFMPDPADPPRADVDYLADPAREGRGVGTKGLEDAGAYLEKRFAELGFAPAGDTQNGVRGYRNAFSVPMKVTPEPGTRVVIDGAEVPAAAFTPLAFSRSADVTAELAFAGYGIKAPELDHDDWKGVSAKGRIAVVRRFSPTTGKFADPAVQRRQGDLRAKAFAAREAGAVALIVVDWPEAGDRPPEEAHLPGLAAESPGDAGIPVVVVTRAASGKLLDGLDGKLASGKGKKKPRARVAVKLRVDTVPAWNVVGRLVAPAAGKLPGVVVLGAHYDHLGYGGRDSLAPDSHAAHLGADDNASGVAGILAAARLLAGHKDELRRDVVLIAFSGEERGLLGSTAFTRKPPAGIDLKEVLAMINLDMVGRLREGRLTILGGGSAEEWASMLKGPCAAARLACKIGGDGFGPSDHTPFFAAGVPVLHFFTGAHPDYHKPSDTADKINAAGIAAVATVVAAAALAVDERPGKLTYKAAPPPMPQGDMRSFNASLGTIPDYAGPPDGRPGVLLAGVRAGGPAQQAGLQRGDILVHLGPHEIRSVEDFMYALNASKPGQQVTATVIRDGKPVELPVTFGAGRR